MLHPPGPAGSGYFVALYRLVPHFREKNNFFSANVKKQHFALAGRLCCFGLMQAF